MSKWVITATLDDGSIHIVECDAFTRSLPVDLGNKGKGSMALIKDNPLVQALILTDILTRGLGTIVKLESEWKQEVA